MTTRDGRGGPGSNQFATKPPLPPTDIGASAPMSGRLVALDPFGDRGRFDYDDRRFDDTAWGDVTDDATEAEAWHDAGFVPREYAVLHAHPDAFAPTLDLARAFHDAEWDAEDTHDWFVGGDGQARGWSDQAWTPEWADAWRRELDPSDRRPVADVAAEALAWDRSGYGPDDVGPWRDAGFTVGDAAAWQEDGLSPTDVAVLVAEAG